jgi:hypothetical protein
VLDEMNEPLGYGAGLAALAPPQVRPVAVAGAALMVGVGLFAFARLHASFGGEPFAIARIEIAPAPPREPVPTAEPSASVQPPAAPPPFASAEQVEGASGVKVIRAGGGGAPDALIIDVDRALAAQAK